jgi:beta-fructofuranosidase
MEQHESTPAAVRQRLASDPHRPLYHFLPPANWMNDPNGLMQWRGRYHLFYQHNPQTPWWGPMYWGHAASTDLVHWQDLPIALSPTPGGPDKDGCWSGCALDNDGVPTFIYTGVHPQCTCIATGSDDLLTWEKYAGNPVIPVPPEGMEVTGFRDHSAWREGDTWYQVIGSGIKGVGGAALLYSSRDLIHWDYAGPLCVGDASQEDPLWTGTMWECPSFFPLGDKHVLIVSAHDPSGQRQSFTIYFVGTYAGHSFQPDFVKRLDLADGLFYAPQTFLDTAGRRIMFGWIREDRPEAAVRAAGWAGLMSLPRILALREDGLPGLDPAPEVKVLRAAHHRVTDLQLAQGTPIMLADVKGGALEIIATFEPCPVGTAVSYGLILRCTPDGAEQTRLLYNPATKRLSLDRALSSQDPAANHTNHEGELDLPDDELLTLHVFLDRSVLEVYANTRACLTSRIYPSRADSLNVGLLSKEGSARLRSLDAWEMNSIWSA